MSPSQCQAFLSGLASAAFIEPCPHSTACGLKPLMQPSSCLHLPHFLPLSDVQLFYIHTPSPYTLFISAVLYLSPRFHARWCFHSSGSYFISLFLSPYPAFISFPFPHLALFSVFNTTLDHTMDHSFSQTVQSDVQMSFIRWLIQSIQTKHRISSSYSERDIKGLAWLFFILPMVLHASSGVPLGNNHTAELQSTIYDSGAVWQTMQVSGEQRICSTVHQVQHGAEGHVQWDCCSGWAWVAKKKVELGSHVAATSCIEALRWPITCKRTFLFFYCFPGLQSILQSHWTCVAKVSIFGVKVHELLLHNLAENQRSAHRCTLAHPALNF